MTRLENFLAGTALLVLLSVLSGCSGLGTSQRERRELSFARAAHSIGQGRAEEPHLIEATPENQAEIARRKERAAQLYREAARLYEEILDEAPTSFAALRGRGVALLRLGIVSKDSRTLETASKILRRCAERREDDRQVRFFRGLCILHGSGRGVLTASSGDLLVEALRLDRDGNYDFHVAYFDLFLYLRAFATPPDVRRAFATSPELTRAVEELVDLLEAYVATGRVAEGAAAADELESIGSYVSTYRHWESERDAATRTLARARKRLKEFEVGAVDRGRSAMELVTAVPPTFTQTPEYVECRATVQGKYAMILMESSRTLIDLGARARPRGYLDTVRELLEGPWIPQPSPIRNEANELSARIDALEEFDQVAARSREFLSQDRSDEARAEYARYRQRLDGSAALALVAHRIEAHEKALEDPEELVRVRNAIRRGDVVEIPGDSPFAADALRAKSVELYQAKDYEGCLATLARIEPATPRDALMKASCYYETGHYQAACELLSASPLDDTSFFESQDYAMAANAFLKFARSSRRSTDRIARYRRAIELFASAEIPVAAIHDQLTECYGNVYQALRNSAIQDPLEIEAVLESLLALEPRDITARRELAFVLYENGRRARSSLERETAYRRAYDLLAELEQEGELHLPLHRTKIYRRLIACYGDFLPLAAGNRWVYIVRNGRTRVVSVKNSTATGHYDVEVDTGMTVKSEVWRKTRDLFSRFDADRLTAKSFPIRLLEPNRRTRWSYPVGEISFEAEIIASGVTCETPAGRFTRCITVRLTNRTTGVEFYHYFAPGVGEVRMESENIHYELTEFRLEPASEDTLAVSER